MSRWLSIGIGLVLCFVTVCFGASGDPLLEGKTADGSALQNIAAYSVYGYGLWTSTSTHYPVFVATTTSGGSDVSYPYTDNGLSYVPFTDTLTVGGLNVNNTAQMTGFKLTTTPGAGYVLTSDANGVGTWQTGGGAGYWTQNGTSIYYNGGYVGLGIAAPEDKLHLKGTGNQYVRAESTDAYSGMFLKNNINSWAIYRTPGTSDLRFFDTADRAVLHSGGLDVLGQIKITGGTPGAGKVLTSDANGTGTWQTGGSGGGDYTFNADNYGTHGTQAAIQAAIDAADDTGGTVFIPAGVWTITSGLVISSTAKGVSLLGEGATDGGTVFTRAGGAFHTLSITGGSSNSENIITGIKFKTSAAMSSGYSHIYITNGVLCNLHHLILLDGYNGITVVDSPSGNFISHCTIQKHSISTTTGYAIWSKSSGGGGHNFLYIDSLMVAGPGIAETGPLYDTGLYVECADGVIVSDSYFAGTASQNVYVLGVSGVQNTGVCFNNCFFDSPNINTNQEYNIVIAGNTGTAAFGFININDSSFNGMGWYQKVDYGIYIANSNVNNVSINNNLLTGHDVSGIALYGGTNVKIDGNTVKGAGSYNPGNYAGIYVASGVSKFSMNGNSSGYAALTSDNSPAGYGIDIASGASDYYIITANNCWGNMYGGVRDSGTGTHKVVVGNAE